MWSAEEWAIRNTPIARHEPWGQQATQNNPWDYNIKIVPDEERPPFLSAAVTTRSQRNAASGEASGSNQGHNTLLSPTNPMRYVPGVEFIHQQHHTSIEENNHVQDLQPQEKTTIPPTPTATRRYNFCKCEGHNASICEENARQTQTSGIESCQQPIWQRYTSISTTATKMTLTSISLLTLTKMIE